MKHIHIVRFFALILPLTCVLTAGAQSRIVHLGIQQGMRNGHVTDMAQDRQGRIWMATEGGLHCWDGYRFTVYDTDNSGLSSNELNTVLTDDDGVNVWVGTRHEGLCRLNTQTGEWTTMLTPDGLLSNGVTRLRHATDGGIWISYYLTGIDHMAPDGTLTHYSNKQIAALKEPFWTAIDDGQGHLYIGHVSDGLSVLDLGTRSVTNYPSAGTPTDLSPLSPDAFDICWDKDGNLWAGGIAGVSVFSPREHRFVRHIPTPTGVASVLCRRSGEMLVGQHGEGVTSMLEDRQGNLWKADGRRGVSIECHEQPLFTHSDTLLARISYAGLDGVNCICHDGNDTYICNNDGLWRQTDGGRPELWTAIDSQLDVPTITYILVDRQDKLWVGTFGGGVYVFTKDGRLVAHHHYDPSPDVSMLMIDSRGRVWGVHHAGISVCADTRHPEQIRTYGLDDGLQNLIQLSVCEDAHGRIWTSNNGGISCLDPETGGIRNYTYAEGIPYDGFVTLSVAKMADGHIVFGQEEGACVFHPDSVSRQRTLPSVFFSQITLLSANSATGTTQRQPVPIDRVKENSFAYDENSFEIALGIDDVSKADAVEFQFRLTAGKGPWFDVGLERLITLQGVSPGHYELEVRARLHNEPWSEPLLTLPITVRQPWWWTWWMRLLYVVIVVAFLWYQWHLYVQRQQLRRRLTERLAAMYAQPSATAAKPVSEPVSEPEAPAVEKQPEKGEPSHADREFLNRLDDLILTHLDNPDLGIQFLTSEMAMSQSTLYRRLKDVTGMSANEYVRRHRLAKAMQLLRDGYNVAEVSVRCGFNSPRYFSRCFKDEYGQLPSEI